MEASQALGAEDYAVLQSMLMSPDADVRAEGQGYAKKLNANEQVEFFNFQKQSRKGQDEQSQRADSAIVSGVPVVGSVAPEDVLMAGVAGRAVKGAMSGVPNVGGRVVAGAKAAAEVASPAIKYEATKFALERMGVPGPLATAAAIAVSGYKRGAKAPAAVEEATVVARPAQAPAPPVAQESPIELTRRLKAENAARASAQSGTVSGGTPPPTGPPVSPAPAAPPKSPQQLLNEEALARRRAEYQAKQAQAPAKPQMTAAEVKEYGRMRAVGKTDAQAREAILASRAMNEKFGLKVPTDKETQFPKGMRGKPRTDQ